MIRVAAPALLLALPIALAACGSSIDLTNASIEEVARMSANIDKPEPGQWKTDATLVSFDAGPVASPMATALKEQLGEVATTEACLDPEEAKKPLFGDLVPTEGANCTFRHFRFDDGKLDAVMACRNADGAVLEVQQRGTYTSTPVDLTSSVRRLGTNGAAQGGMTTKINARRTGDCTPDATANG